MFVAPSVTHSVKDSTFSVYERPRQEDQSIQISGYSAQYFPVRPLIRIGETDGAWLVAHKAEERRRFNELLRQRHAPRRPAEASAHGGGTTGPPTSQQDDEPTCLDGFYLLRVVRVDDPSFVCHVDLSGRNLTEVKEDDLQLFDSVTSLKVGENLLKIEPLNGFPNLRELEIPFNGLRNLKLTADSFPNLEFLDVSYNELTKEDLFNIGLLKRLRRLHAGGNGLSELPEDLSLPEIALDGEANQRFQSLECLMLDDNRLSDPKAFASLASLRKLKVLSLEKNEFSGIPYLKVSEEGDGISVTLSPSTSAAGTSRQRVKSARGSSSRRSTARSSRRRRAGTNEAAVAQTTGAVDGVGDLVVVASQKAVQRPPQEKEAPPRDKSSELPAEAATPPPAAAAADISTGEGTAAAAVVVPSGGAEDTRQGEEVKLYNNGADIPDEVGLKQPTTDDTSAPGPDGSQVHEAAAEAVADGAQMQESSPGLHPKNEDSNGKPEVTQENGDPKPKSEDTQENEDSKPKSEDAQGNEDSKPKSEDTHENEDSKPKSEDTHENEDSKPKSDDTHENEDSMPKSRGAREKDSKPKFDDTHENEDSNQQTENTQESGSSQPQVEIAQKNEGSEAKPEAEPEAAEDRGQEHPEKKEQTIDDAAGSSGEKSTGTQDVAPNDDPKSAATEAARKPSASTGELNRNIEQLNLQMMRLNRPASAPLVELAPFDLREIERAIGRRLLDRRQVAGPAPFPALRSLNLGSNRVAREEALVACGIWPALAELLVYDNPLSRSKSGELPLLHRLLTLRLGVRIAKQKPQQGPKPRIEVEPKPSRRVVTRVPPVPRVDVDRLLMGIRGALEPPPQGQGQEEPLQASAKGPTEATEEEGAAAAAADASSDWGDADDKADGAGGVFLTSVADQSAEAAGADGAAGATASGRRQTDEEVEDLDDVDLLLSDAFGGQADNDDENADLPQDVLGSVKALQYLLDHPLTLDHRRPPLAEADAAYREHRATRAAPAPAPRQTRAEQVSEAIETSRRANPRLELPLTGVLQAGGRQAQRQQQQQPALPPLRVNASQRRRLEQPPSVARSRGGGGAVSRTEARRLLGGVQRRYQAVRDRSLQQAKAQAKEKIAEMVDDIRASVHQSLRARQTTDEEAA